VAQGCFLLFDGEYSGKVRGEKIFYNNKLPDKFKRCSNLNELCVACRMFGLISGDDCLRMGNVGLEDAICVKPVSHDPIFTAVLSAPKPHHQSWYLQAGKIAGRKFYFHSTQLLTEKEAKISKTGKQQNAYIRPLGAGSSFTFAVEFVNVTEGDFAALLYAMMLEPGMRHNFGYAKPCGLGTIRIEMTKLMLLDPAARYRKGAGKTVLEGEDLVAEVSRRVTPFVATIPPITLSDMRRIWRWPPDPTVTYSYPTQGQFKAHPIDPISSTPRWWEI
jgi:hypothetical protein